MILAVDMGNTNIVLGGIEKDEIVFECRISTDIHKTEAEYSVLIKNVFDVYKINVSDIEGSIISSVVPPLTKIISNSVKLVTGQQPTEVSINMKHPVKFVTENPSQIGADLLVAAVAALKEFAPPLIIIDMGTATTVTVIGKKSELLGVSIMPGVRISQEALSMRASQLPSISFDAPKSVIGTNTVDSMKSGLIFGNASMIDGMIDRIEAEINEEARVVATGGLAGSIVSNCKHKIPCDDSIMLKGLNILYKMNKN